MIHPADEVRAALAHPVPVLPRITLGAVAGAFAGALVGSGVLVAVSHLAGAGPSTARDLWEMVTIGSIVGGTFGSVLGCFTAALLPDDLPILLAAGWCALATITGSIITTVAGGGSFWGALTGFVAGALALALLWQMVRRRRRALAASALVMALTTAISFGVGSGRYPGDQGLSAALTREVAKGPGTTVDVKALTRFPWTEMLIFGPYTDILAVGKATGRRWRGSSSIFSTEGANLVVFLNGRDVVAQFDHPEQGGDFVLDSVGVTRRTRASARFIVTRGAFGEPQLRSAGAGSR